MVKSILTIFGIQIDLKRLDGRIFSQKPESSSEIALVV